MKKVILFALIAVLFSSCVEEYYSGVPETRTVSFTVFEKDWEVASDITGDYLYYTFDMPEITRYVFDNGVLNAYLYYKPDGTDTSVLCPLPFSDFVVQENGYKYEEHITAEFAIGEITFIVKVDDHEVGNILQAKKYDFIVRLMW